MHSDKTSDENNIQQPNVINLGCRLNDYESNVIKNILKSTNLENDTIVINTCAVTKEAEKQSRQTVRKLKKQFPNKKIIVTGCAAQINPEQFNQMPEVDKVVGNSFKTDTETYKNISNEWSSPLQVNTEKVLINDIMSIKETAEHLMPVEQNRSRAFLQIQNGCNHRCTFCIIPYGRGNSRSVPVAQVINNIKTLVASGYNEIVLTGVDITDYGSDLPGNPKLGNLCKRILASTELKRLRLSSVDVAEIDEDLIDLIRTEPRFMPYFHISLQSGDNLILKRMKRRHNREQVIEFCKNIRNFRPEAGFGADIICGFPTETEDMFQNTMNLVEECKIQYIHAFTYSARTGTPAAKMPQVLLAKRKERTNKLMKLGAKNLEEFLISMINSTQNAVLEHGNIARAENFAPITLKNVNNTHSPMQILRVECTEYKDGKLFGVIISKV